jgi:hypothetical protein
VQVDHRSEGIIVLQRMESTPLHARSVPDPTSTSTSTCDRVSHLRIPDHSKLPATERALCGSVIHPRRAGA